MKRRNFLRTVCILPLGLIPSTLTARGMGGHQQPIRPNGINSTSS